MKIQLRHVSKNLTKLQGLVRIDTHSMKTCCRKMEALFQCSKVPVLMLTQKEEQK